MTVAATQRTEARDVVRNAPRWYLGRRTDAALWGAWVPFALAVRVADGRGAAGAVLEFAFVLSLVHQPLTLALVYGDATTRTARRRLFTWAPVALGALVLVGLQVSLVALAVVAGLWNAVHTMLQRYGIVRIYGRRSGQLEAAGERGLLLSWLGLALLWAAADASTPDRVRALDLGRRNETALEVLTGLRPIAVPACAVLLVVVAVLTTRWVRAERVLAARGEANPAKWLYVGSTAALLAWSVADPVGAFTAYIGSHALEYLVVVNGSLRPRWSVGAGVVPRVLAGRFGRVRFFAGYGATMAGLLALLRWGDGGALPRTIVLVAGGLHILYDGYIWKLRQPAVAAAVDTSVPGGRT